MYNLHHKQNLEVDNTRKFPLYPFPVNLHLLPFDPKQALMWQYYELDL